MFFENTSPSRSLCPDNWFECELLWCSISFWIPNNELKNPSPDSPLLLMLDVLKADLLKILELKGNTSLFDTFILDLKKWEISCSLTEQNKQKVISYNNRSRDRLDGTKTDFSASCYINWDIYYLCNQD